MSQMYMHLHVAAKQLISNKRFSLSASYVCQNMHADLWSDERPAVAAAIAAYEIFNNYNRLDIIDSL